MNLRMAKTTYGRRMRSARRYSKVGRLILALSVTAFSTDGVAQELELYTAVPNLRIGSLDDPGTALSRITGLVVDRSGRMYVAESGTRSIRVFDRDGTPAREIGRSGEGPGEFRSVGELGTHGDSLWAIDRSLNRISFFGPDGEYRGDEPARREPPAEHPEFVMIPKPLADGSWLVQSSARSEMIASGDVESVPLFREPDGGAAWDTLAWISMRNRTAHVAIGSSVHYLTQIYGNFDLVSIAPDGSTVVVVERPMAEESGSASFRITKFFADGQIAFQRDYDFQPMPLPRRDALSRIDGFADSFIESGRLPDTGAARRQFRQAFYVPEFWPPVQEVKVGMDGSIWLRREVRPGENGPRWHVLNSDGRPRGEVHLPPGVRLLQARDPYVWGTVEDDLGVPYLVRHRLRRAE